MDLLPDDKEDQEAGKGDNAVEDQVGEQQPGAAADGWGGEHLSHKLFKLGLTTLTRDIDLNTLTR